MRERGRGLVRGRATEDEAGDGDLIDLNFEPLGTFEFLEEVQGFEIDGGPAVHGPAGGVKDELAIEEELHLDGLLGGPRGAGLDDKGDAVFERHIKEMEEVGRAEGAEEDAGLIRGAFGDGVATVGDTGAGDCTRRQGGCGLHEDDIRRSRLVDEVRIGSLRIGCGGPREAGRET